MSRSVSIKNLVRERNALRERIRLLREPLQLIADGKMGRLSGSLAFHPFIEEKAQRALAADDEAAAAAEAAKEEPRPPLGPLPGMVAGYWFEPSEVIPGQPPGHAPSSALLAPLTGARAPALVLVERAGEWFPMSEAASLTYSFTRGGAGVRFVAWGPQGRLVQASRFVLVEAGTVGRLYGREVAARCYGGRRIVGVQAMFEPAAEQPSSAPPDREVDLSGVTAESIAEALSPAPASPAVPPGPPPPLATPWLSIRAAADLLSMTEAGLRKALERRAERRGDATIADLDGIRGRKLGSRWRVSLAALDAQLKDGGSGG